ncbi:MAG TPA: SEC-C metal-binding domain-containing protein, partial [Treponemataceae bacterium]|nr:SEC-C metal-binding domain-containing protein [Treponemataceae bacterium]
AVQVNAHHSSADGFAGALPAGRGTAMSSSSTPDQAQVVRVVPKVGRNDPCPCGSGKKYKYCHGA